jgi:hypothetical protein
VYRGPPQLRFVALVKALADVIDAHMPESA